MNMKLYEIFEEENNFNFFLCNKFYIACEVNEIAGIKHF